MDYFIRCLGFGCLTLGLCFGCEQAPVRVFDDPPSVRRTKAVEKRYEQLLDAKEGWHVTYTPTEGGGYNYIIRFLEDNVMEVKSDFLVRDAQGRLVEDRQQANFFVELQTEIVLVFANYTPVHALADPIYGEFGKGFGGDFEFYFEADDADPEVIRLKGKVKGNELILRRLNNDIKNASEAWTRFEKKILDVQSDFSTYRYDMKLQIRHPNKTQLWDVDLLGRSLQIEESGTSSNTQSIAVRYTPTGEGIVLHRSYELLPNVSLTHLYNQIKGSGDKELFSTNQSSVQVHWTILPPTAHKQIGNWWMDYIIHVSRWRNYNSPDANRYIDRYTPAGYRFDAIYLANLANVPLVYDRPWLLVYFYTEQNRLYWIASAMDIKRKGDHVTFQAQLPRQYSQSPVIHTYDDMVNIIKPFEELFYAEEGFYIKPEGNLIYLDDDGNPSGYYSNYAWSVVDTQGEEVYSFYMYDFQP